MRVTFCFALDVEGKRGVPSFSLKLIIGGIVLKNIKILLFILVATILLGLIGCQKDEVTPAMDQKSSAVEEVSGDANIDDQKEKVKQDDITSANSVAREETEKAKDVETNTTTEPNTKEKSGQDIDSSNEKSTQESTFANSNSSSTASKTTPATTEKQAEKTVNTSSSNKEPNTEEKKSTQTQTNTATKQAETPKETPATPPVTKEEPKKQEPKPTVTISVVGDSEKGTILSATQVEMSEGNTVLDVTLKVLKSKGIPISVTGGGSSAYVQGIGNLFEFDRGPTSGWTVKQNGATLSRSTGVTKVSNGDKIQWIYTTNYKED